MVCQINVIGTCSKKILASRSTLYTLEVPKLRIDVIICILIVETDCTDILFFQKCRALSKLIFNLLMGRVSMQNYFQPQPCSDASFISVYPSTTFHSTFNALDNRSLHYMYDAMNELKKDYSLESLPAREPFLE